MSTAKIDAVPAPNECPTRTKVNVCVLRSGFLLRAFSTRFSSRNLLRLRISESKILPRIDITQIPISILIETGKIKETTANDIIDNLLANLRHLRHNIIR
uniref:Uncharacterized protein n=1 Tax=Glossina palpalis gambiensis TaxID=67801 RepID=A0A1B0BDF9_9MUSC